MLLLSKSPYCVFTTFVHSIDVTQNKQKRDPFTFSSHLILTFKELLRLLYKNVQLLCV